MRAMRHVIEARVPSASENFCAPVTKLRKMALTIFPALSTRRRHIPRADFAGLFCRRGKLRNSQSLSCLLFSSRNFVNDGSVVTADLKL